jgi:hypothetical protein
MGILQYQLLTDSTSCGSGMVEASRSVEIGVTAVPTAKNSTGVVEGLREIGQLGIVTDIAERLEHALVRYVVHA